MMPQHYKHYRGQTRLGDYDHLDKSTDMMLHLTVPMDELAEKIVRLNYGTHRFLSSLVRARLKIVHPEDELARLIADMLNAGFW